MNVTSIEYIKAGSPIVAVRTTEEQRALQQLQHEYTKEDFNFVSWDVASGGDMKLEDPLELLNWVTTLKDEEATPAVIFALDLHKLLNNPVIVRAMVTAVNHALTLPLAFILIGEDFSKLPQELSTYVSICDFALPNECALREIAAELLQDNKIKGEIPDDVITAAKGLTQVEAENAFSVSLVKHQKLDRELVLAQKLQAVQKSGLLEIYEPETEDNVGGMSELKAYIHSRVIGFTDPKYPRPQGILMVGPPGAGKSLAAKMIANILKMPLLRLDFASMKSKYVGDSEARVKRVLSLIDAVSPCVVWMDKFLFM